MKIISVGLTIESVQDQSKTVSRRLGFQKLKIGDLLQPVRKCMGLKKGEAIERIGCPIKVLEIKREPLHKMLDYPDYGLSECIKEGLPRLSPREFVALLCKTYKIDTMQPVTRIKWEYTESKKC
jgi:hypothetical protein